MFPEVRRVVDQLSLKLGKTEKVSCRPEVSLMCSHLCRLDIAIHLGKRKERVPCFGRQRGTIYRWQIRSDCFGFGFKSTAVTVLVSPI